jgi:molybdenum cofactor cytidylyltransferase
VLFDERHFEALEDVSGDAGGRELLLDGDRAAIVETGDPGVVRDVDTEADLDEHRRS